MENFTHEGVKRQQSGRESGKGWTKFGEIFGSGEVVRGKERERKGMEIF